MSLYVCYHTSVFINNPSIICLAPLLRVKCYKKDLKGVAAASELVERQSVEAWWQSGSSWVMRVFWLHLFILHDIYHFVEDAIFLSHKSCKTRKQ